MIVDHRVRLEDITADLAAERHVLLVGIEEGLGGGQLVGLALIQLVLELLHGRRLILELRALGLRRTHETGRHVRDADGGRRLVHVLSARAGGAIHIDPEVFVADLDVDLFVHDRIYEHRSEARMTPRLRIERRDAHEPVHTRLWTQEAIGVLPLDLDHGALDASFFALAEVEHLEFEAFAFSPSREHAHQ